VAGKIDTLTTTMPLSVPVRKFMW